MSQPIDPKEVLVYLNELGYTNISAQQLKDFIIDLKKIIKYEYKRRKYLVQNGYSNLCESSGSYTQNTENAGRIKSPSRISKPDIFEILHNLPTEAFKAKIVTKRQRQPLALHITQSKKKNLEHWHCIHVGDDKKDCVDINAEPSAEHLEDQPMLSDKMPDTDDNLTSKKTTESTLDSRKQTKTGSSRNEGDTGSSRISSLRPTSKQSQSSSMPSTNFTKSKTQVLRPPTNRKSINKSDPVSLYHEYQKQWKTIKFPGQNSHLDLRWAIREKLLNGPPVQVIRKPSAKKTPFA